MLNENQCIQQLCEYFIQDKSADEQPGPVFVQSRLLAWLKALFRTFSLNWSGDRGHDPTEDGRAEIWNVYLCIFCSVWSLLFFRGFCGHLTTGQEKPFWTSVMYHCACRCAATLNPPSQLSFPLNRWHNWLWFKPMVWIYHLLHMNAFFGPLIAALKIYIYMLALQIRKYWDKAYHIVLTKPSWQFERYFKLWKKI